MRAVIALNSFFSSHNFFYGLTQVRIYYSIPSSSSFSGVGMPLESQPISE
jgi:hypothetical protein